jgi:hypothetical protein
MVAMLTASVGSLARAPRVVRDGQIIDGDKDALGRAWGKLAETNETWRKILVSATSGGAWVEVAVVTSTTASKMWQNHAEPRGEATANGSAPDPSASLQPDYTG